MIRGGQTTGVLSGAVPLDGIQSIIRAIRHTPSRLAFVVATDGQVIEHVYEQLAIKPSTDVAPELTPAALSAMSRDGAEPLAVNLDGVP
ncbi:hypothetical protein G6F45_013930 [Rhizopus arrhizus]|nr:hypothetical protein G6F45_013930 [Rhizopus arrhizus]